MSEEMRRVRQQLLDAVDQNERAVVILYNGVIPPTVQRGRFTGQASGGIQYQRCGGGRRIVRKRIGGT